MAILSTVIDSGLVNGGTLIDPEDDFSKMVWIQPVNVNHSGSTYRSYNLLRDTSYTNYIEISGEGTLFGEGNFGITVHDPSGGFQATTAKPGLLDTAYHIAVTYDLSAKELLVYINGTLTDTLTGVDFTGVTFTDEFLLTDTEGSAANQVGQNYRSWQGKVLTADGIAIEMASNTAVDTVNLLNDDPLTNTSTLGDWTVAGSVTNYILYDVKFISGNANTSALTALTIPYLPYKLVQSALNVTAQDLWYSFLGSAAFNIVSAWGYAPNATYLPRLKVFSGPASSPTSVLDISSEIKPIQFPTDGGTTYLLQADRLGASPTNATLLLQVGYIGNEAATVGDIIDPDDTAGFPASVIRDGVVTFVKPFASGEQGDSLDDGTILMVDTGAAGNPVKVYSDPTTLIATLNTLTTQDKFVRANNGLNIFYVATAGLGGDDVIVYTVDSSGVLGSTTWNLGSSTAIGTPGSSGGIAANNDGTILYYTASNDAVQRWDLVNDVILSDFLAPVAGFSVIDILVQKDDTILVSYNKDSAPRHLFVRRFDAAASLLTDYDFGGDITDTPSRMFYSIDNPNTFWIWIHVESTTGLSEFREIDIVTEAVVTTRSVYEFENGESQQDATPTPAALNGISFSCPAFVLRNSFVPPVNNPLSGIYKIVPWSAKQNDTLYTSLDPVETEDVKIPDPTATTGLIGE